MLRNGLKGQNLQRILATYVVINIPEQRAASFMKWFTFTKCALVRNLAALIEKISMMRSEQRKTDRDRNTKRETEIKIERQRVGVCERWSKSD